MGLVSSGGSKCPAGGYRLASANSENTWARSSSLAPFDFMCDKIATSHKMMEMIGDGACFDRNRILDSMFTAGTASWEGAMLEYSIYTITDEDLQFSECCTVVHCADDKEALQAAAQWVDLHDVELWESNRFITRLHPSNFQMLD
jgi:hypothetical protein